MLGFLFHRMNNALILLKLLLVEILIQAFLAGSDLAASSVWPLKFSTMNKLGKNGVT